MCSVRATLSSCALERNVEKKNQEREEIKYYSRYIMLEYAWKPHTHQVISDNLYELASRKNMVST